MELAVKLESIRTNSLAITPAILKLIAAIDEFKVGLGGPRTAGASMAR